MKYEEFSASRSRKDLVELTEYLAVYLKEKNIGNVILLDRSARPAYLGLVKVWRKMFPDAKRPNIYFVNPDGFQPDDDEKSKEQILKEFRYNYPALAGKKEKVLIFDTCIHSGNTISPVIETLEANGSQVYAGILQKDSRLSLFDSSKAFPYLDFLAKRKPFYRCAVLGLDKLATKTNSVTSERTKPMKIGKYDCEITAHNKRILNAQIEESLRIRKEISNIFKERGY